MRKVLASLVVLLSLVTTVVAEAPPEFCVRVFVEDTEGHSMGSGTLVAPHLIVTNEHVVRDRKAGGSVKVLFPNWDVVNGKVVKTDKRWDIAVILISPVDIEPVVFAKQWQAGELLTIYGYGMGYPASATGRYFAEYSPDANSPAQWIEIKGVRARQGDSGGPILNASGEYVGTLFGSVTNFTVGTRVDRVKKILGTLLQE